MNPNNLKTILVTGASGIVGSNFLMAAMEDFIIYAIARRPQKEAEILEHPNIKWIQVDIGNIETLRQVIKNVIKHKVDFVLHLAAYYDFSNKDNPEYERTNVNGTLNILNIAKELNAKHFIFASSVAASEIPSRGNQVNEKSVVDANYAYAISKRKGEQMTKEFSIWFSCSIVRFAAVFTDWCEYGPLYMFLSTWLSRKWNSRILGGRGESGIPFIHVNDLNKLLLTIFRDHEKLPNYHTLIGGPDGSITHKELFDFSTRYFFGQRIKPLTIPKPIAIIGIVVRDTFGRLIGKRPFERLWMSAYIDKKLNINSSYTRNLLNWEPTPRFNILRRLLYMIERMKTDPYKWQSRNTRALKHVAQRPSFVLYEHMVKIKEEIDNANKKALLDPERNKEFPNYQSININDFNWDVSVFYQLLTATVRNQDRMILINYLRDVLVPIRFKEGFDSNEVCSALLETGKIIITRLLKEPDLEGMEQIIHDNISLTIQLSVDEVENAFEKLANRSTLLDTPDRSVIESKLEALATFYDGK